MKILKYILLFLLLMAIGACMCRGWLFRHAVVYRAVGLRANYAARDSSLIHYIDSNVSLTATPDVAEIVEQAEILTSRRLEFTFGRNENDPNRLIHTPTANCIGYAAFFAGTCNYLLQKYHLSEWLAQPRVGQLFLFDKNMHHYINDPFFKDHDFATVENMLTGDVLAVDPTVHDYLLIDGVSYVK